jgi:hypothetical protein
MKPDPHLNGAIVALQVDATLRTLHRIRHTVMQIGAATHMLVEAIGTVEDDLQRMADRAAGKEH